MAFQNSFQEVIWSGLPVRVRWEESVALPFVEEGSQSRNSLYHRVLSALHRNTSLAVLANTVGVGIREDLLLQSSFLI